MSRYLIIRTGPVDWSERKHQEMGREIKLYLGRNGAPNAEVIVAPWPPAAEAMPNLQDPTVVRSMNPPVPPPAPKDYLHLQCLSCKVGWYEQAFTTCPLCGEKRTVKKAIIRRVPLPPGVMAGAQHARPISKQRSA